MSILIFYLQEFGLNIFYSEEKDWAPTGVCVGIYG